MKRTFYRNVNAYDDGIQVTYIVGGTEANNFEDGLEYASIEEVGDRDVTGVRVDVDLEKAKSKEIDFKFDGIKGKVSFTLTKADLVHEVEWGKHAYLGLRSQVDVHAQLDFESLSEKDYIKD